VTSTWVTFIDLHVLKITLCILQNIDVLVAGYCYFIALQNQHPYVDRSMHLKIAMCVLMGSSYAQLYMD
jgi:hypothetical protein